VLQFRAINMQGEFVARMSFRREREGFSTWNLEGHLCPARPIMCVSKCRKGFQSVRSSSESTRNAICKRLSRSLRMYTMYTTKGKMILQAVQLSSESTKQRLLSVDIQIIQSNQQITLHFDM
jgi:hypothetical protein